MTALDVAIARMAEQAPRTVARLMDAVATRMVGDPKLILKALGRPVCWPPAESLPVLLAECKRRLGGYHNRMRHGHEDALFQVEDLRAAELALLRMIATEDES